MLKKVEDGLSERLKKEAVALGLCRQWQREWKRGTDMNELADKFICGLDFCIEHDWPSCEFIKREFPLPVRHAHGVYVDEDVSETENTGTLVLMGGTKAVLSFGGMSVKDIYVRHNSELSLRVEGDAKVFMTVYDNAVIHLTQDESAKVFVYRYGGTVNTDGRAVVRDRLNNLITKK